MLIKIRNRGIGILSSLVIVLLSNMYLMNLKEKIEGQTTFKVFDMLHGYTTKDVQIGLNTISNVANAQYNLFLIVDLVFFITALCAFQLQLHYVINQKVHLKIWYRVSNIVVTLRMLGDVAENFCLLSLLKNGYDQMPASILILCSNIKWICVMLWMLLIVVGIVGVVIRKLQSMKYEGAFNRANGK